MNLAELSRYEIEGHNFHRIRLEKQFDWWVCQYVIDGVKREEFLEPASNVASLSSDDFETYMKAQSLAMPPARR